jgi:hypothetical protein
LWLFPTGSGTDTDNCLREPVVLRISLSVELPRRSGFVAFPTGTGTGTDTDNSLRVHPALGGDQRITESVNLVVDFRRIRDSAPDFLAEKG